MSDHRGGWSPVEENWRGDGRVKRSGGSKDGKTNEGMVNYCTMCVGTVAASCQQLNETFLVRREEESWGRRTEMVKVEGRVDRGREGTSPTPIVPESVAS